MKKKQILTAALLVFAMAAVSIVQAASFVIRDIRVEGLQRVSVGTVFNNIPYEVGQTVSDDAAREIIRSLYGTGLFKDVSLQQDGGVLVVTVVERPTIASIDITGNKDIDTDQLKQGLRDSGFAEGRVYNEFVLDKIKQDLKRSYFDRGKYGVTISSTVSPLERNRVALELQIREGRSARIKRINIVGNEDFDEDDITDEMELSTSGIFSRFTKNDQYSAQKL
jgi:outer membrane protein insertion porin family